MLPELGHRAGRERFLDDPDALEQVTRDLDTAGLDEGWLVMFDLRSTLPWEKRLSTRTVEVSGKRVYVVGC